MKHNKYRTRRYYFQSPFKDDPARFRLTVSFAGDAQWGRTKHLCMLDWTPTGEPGWTPLFSDIIEGLFRFPVEIMYSAMFFFTLQAGDTDADYFDKYTPEQIAFRDKYADSLGCDITAREERHNEQVRDDWYGRSSMDGGSQ